MDLMWWSSVGMAIGVITLHATARFVTHRIALDACDRRTFLVREVGGLIGRMGFVFAAVALVLLYIPAHEKVFVTAVLALLVVSMIAEAYLIHRHMERGALEP